MSAAPFGFYHVTTTDYAGNESDAASIDDPTTSVDSSPVLPGEFALHAAHPNPLRGGTAFVFDLPAAQTVSLTIFDVTGRRVRVVVDAFHDAGRHLVGWDGRGLSGDRVPAGVYFARLEGETSGALRRIVVIS